MTRYFSFAALLLSFHGIGGAAVPVPTFLDRYDLAPGCAGVPSSPEPVVADTNGDGIPDLICGEAKVTVSFGNGDGTFRAGPVSEVVSGYSLYPLPVDLNGDGKIDLLLIGLLPGNQYGLAVSFGNGDGTFQPATFYPTGSEYDMTWIVVGDFNHDGLLDAAVLGNSGAWLFLGTGGGLFRPGVLTPLVRALPDAGLIAADLNGDGNLDLIAGQGIGATALLGKGDGTFRPQMNISSGLKVADAFVLGDLDGDGNPDLVFTYLVQGVTFCHGNGDGTFSAPRSLLVAPATSITIADVNGDGIPDLVTSGVNVALGNGDGSFQYPQFYAVSDGPGSPTYIVAADLRNSGHADLVVGATSNSTSILLNQGKGTYQDGKSVPVDHGQAYCFGSGDFNGDGKPDLAVTISTGISILLGTENFAEPFKKGSVIPLSVPGCPLVGDLNGDGIPDLTVTSGDVYQPGAVVTFLGNGDGTFRAGSSSPVAAIGVLAMGDFNGDGHLDYALSSDLIGYGNGDGTFQKAIPFVPYVESSTQVTGFTSIGAGKLKPGRGTDLIMLDGSHGLVYELLAKGGNKFQETIFATGDLVNFPIAPTIADVNGDGFNDLVLGGVDNYTPIYLNDGTGKLTYALSLDFQPADDASLPLVADVNGDGIADILIQGNFDIGVFLGQGSLTFAAPFYLGMGLAPGNLLALPVHGQGAHSGKPDLVLTDEYRGVEVIYNLTK